MNRVLLAYSGSVEGTVCIDWLQHSRHMEVATLSANLGQGEALQAIGERALETGAETAHLQDLREEFARDYVVPTLKANAEAAVGRPLSSALSRALISAELAKIAVEDNRSHVGHAGKPMSADQTQFEGSVASLAPNLRVIAPLREWELHTRDDVLAYANKHDIEVDPARLQAYSVDRNLWGVRLQCPELDELWGAPPEHIYQITRSAQDAPDKPDEVVIGFDAGVPVSLDGKPTALLPLIETLTELGGLHGIGRHDIVEDRMTGVRARRVYEAPAAAVLYAAHTALESIVLSRSLLRCKAELAKQYAELIYAGRWFSDLRQSLSAFVDGAQRYVTGEARLQLYKANIVVLGRRSPCSMYNAERNAPAHDRLDGEAMGGYAKIMSLPLKTQARRAERKS